MREVHMRNSKWGTRITKAQIQNRIVQRHSFSPELVSTAIEAFLWEIEEAISRGDSVTIENFGRFEPKVLPEQVKPKIGGKRGEMMWCRSKCRVKFTPSPRLVRNVTWGVKGRGLL